MVGESQDANVQSLIQSSIGERVVFVDLEHSLVSWDLLERPSILTVDRVDYEFQAAFLRPPIDSSRDTSIFALVIAFVKHNRDIKIFNRDRLGVYNDKCLNLLAAQATGLSVTSTLVTNDMDFCKVLPFSSFGLVYKPIQGGELVTWRNPACNRVSFVQKLLCVPEMRVFCITELDSGVCSSFVFFLRSSSLDYRESHDCSIEWICAEDLCTLGIDEIVQKTGQLSESLGFSFSASDFKMDWSSNSFQFLEINSCPMFSEFDRITAGTLLKTLISCWIGKRKI